MEDGVRHNGWWLKALEQAEGNIEKQVTEYIKLSVESPKDDINRHSNSASPNNSIFNGCDIEELVAMLNSNVTVVSIEDYLYGMHSQEIKCCINLYDGHNNYPIHISVKKSSVGFGSMASWSWSKSDIEKLLGIHSIKYCRTQSWQRRRFLATKVGSIDRLAWPDFPSEVATKTKDSAT